MPRRRGHRRGGRSGSSGTRGRGRGGNIETIGIDISDEEDGYGQMPQGYNAENLVQTSRRRRGTESQITSKLESSLLVPLPSLLPKAPTPTSDRDQKRKRIISGRSCKRGRLQEDDVICVLSDDSDQEVSVEKIINKPLNRTKDVSASDQIISIPPEAAAANFKAVSVQNKEEIGEQTEEEEKIEVNEKKPEKLSELSFQFADDDFSKFEDDDDIEFENIFMKSYDNNEERESDEKSMEEKESTKPKRVFLMPDTSSSDEDATEHKDAINCANDFKEREKLEQEVDAELDEELNKITQTTRKNQKRFLRKKDENLIKKIERQALQYNLVDQLTGLPTVFSSISNQEVLEIVENTKYDESKVVVFTVVYSNQKKFMKLHIDQPFAALVRQLSVLLKIPTVQMILYHNAERIDNNETTPLSAGLTGGGILDLDISNTFSDEDYIRLKFRHKSKTSNHSVDIGYKVPYESKLEKVMKEFATALEADITHLSFRFDGDVIKSTCTPSELDLDDDDVIDVIKSNS
ncbi:DgyrCDS3719 [Dimorphilus gyrociliatus]|uniref:DgyrCDS3719 n=1 Tax=Dimorphilus gyrociliatus TaxID=2664684 RepID=A0A7I8VFC2_9ANNE|nr:DgyrCDS3719 [Dimorphilus gyrociliatus]